MSKNYNTPPTAPVFPDESLRPDAVIHGGGGKNQPPAQNDGEVKPLDATLKGRDAHNATGSYNHKAGMNPAAQPPPEKTNFAAPKRKGD